MVRAVIFDMYETLITHYRSPLYFGEQIAADAGLTEPSFRALWDPTDADRSTGRLTFEATIEMILRTRGRYSPELAAGITARRISAKEACFTHLHDEILPMLAGLRARGMRIGLISNCYSEEAAVIRKSALAPYFDAMFLSWEQGVMKPDREIFRRCTEALGVSAAECLYVGDGGSHELETARMLGMQAVQAVWYLDDDARHPGSRKPDFPQAEHPLAILEAL